MSDQIVLKNATVVLANEVITGTVAVSAGKITAIEHSGSSSNGAIDVEGDLLLPGLVELHTDNFERHLMPRPQVAWAELPALLAHDAEVTAAGITTVFDALGVGDADEEQLRGKGWQQAVDSFNYAAASDLLRADHHLHVRCELPAPNTIELFAPFEGHPRLGLISLMDHSPGQRQWENVDKARVYYTGKKGWSHEKFERQVAQAIALQERYANPHRKHFVDYCRERAVTLASHDDTTVDHVQQALDEGVHISEFPTTVAAADCARANGLSIVMGAPNVVRGGSHSGNVSAAELARRDRLDTLSSDYVPSSLLMAALQLTIEADFSLPRAISTISRNPARSVGMVDRGEIAVGLRADLVRVRMVENLDRAHGPRRLPVVRAVWREGERVL